MNRLLTFFGAVAATLSLAGCSTTALQYALGFQQPTSFSDDDWRKIGQTFAVKNDISLEQKNVELAVLYGKVINVCNSVANYYGRKAQFGDSNRLAIGLLGSISAGVVAPVLSAGSAAPSAIAGWSSVGGVTSGYLTALDDSVLSTQTSISVRSKVVEEITRASDRNAIPFATTDAEVPKHLSGLVALYSRCKNPIIEAPVTRENIASIVQQAVTDAMKAQAQQPIAPVHVAAPAAPAAVVASGP
ncbi:hypothetical protein [Chitiniphilus shinanonensis]|uniref:hypothetical protein n=1 Tax=Chitiniphilus shinanonensis TaxID=553088 RepID=UPI003342E153